jgi:uncharacterized membrane protein YkoI
MNSGKLIMVFLFLILFADVTTCVVNAQNQNQDEKKFEKQKDDDDKENKDSPKVKSKLAKQATISMEEARRTALEKVPGTVIESELEKENGRLVYEFEIRDKDNKTYDVQVDAKTGEVVSVEEENDDEEDTDQPQTSKQNESSKWYKVWRKIPGLRKKRT